MSELPPRFNFKEAEEKWQKVWEEKQIFHAKPNSSKKPYSIVIPPPNVTGILHMGHALNCTLQDIMARYKRMNGFETCWMPGTDHAGIATQNVVEKELAKEGKTRDDIGRAEMLKRLWKWKDTYGDTIINQLKKLGASCDWPRTRFTMDPEYSEAVKHVFVELYKKGLIYRGKYIINWCPRCQTALSDEEAEHKETQGSLYYIRYPFKINPKKFIVVATTRPETMLGDTAVAVNPKDKRYKKFIGETLVLPILNREIKIIEDDLIDLTFGTGAVKVTPAHDPNDFVMGKRHNLEFINIMHPDGRLNETAGKFSGMDRFDGRKAVIKELEQSELLEKVEPHNHAVGHCYRCNTVVEPYLSNQWFVKMKPLAEPALQAVVDGTIKFYPDRWTKVYTNWMEGIRDWCISRQIWWGHRIPVWYKKVHLTEENWVDELLKWGWDDFVEGNWEKAEKNYPQSKTMVRIFRCDNSKEVDPKDNSLMPVVKETEGEYEIFIATTDEELEKLFKKAGFKQDEDVLDTWFSSWLWPFATFGWPQEAKSEERKAKSEKTSVQRPASSDLNYFYPTNSLFTASEIIFFWVSRMIMAGYEFTRQAPFRDVYIHGTVRDAKGRKMSKSLGNALDPLEIVNEYGADALRFSLIMNSGQDLFITKEKFEGGRNFANKIWNASRLVLLNTKIKTTTDHPPPTTDLASRWIVSKFYSTLTEVNSAIEGYRFPEAENLIYDFFWKNYCDWYLEIIKNKLSDENIQKTAFFILAESIRMMHPFMPFVTEELWANFGISNKPLSLETWPQYKEKSIDRSALSQMETLINLVSKIRNIKSQLNIKSQNQIECHFAGDDTILKENEEALKSLLKIKDFHIHKNLPQMKDAVVGVVDSIKFALPLAGLIDITREKEKLHQEIENAEKSSKGISQRLKNEDFVSKAPTDVIEKEQARVIELTQKIKELKEILKNLQ